MELELACASFCRAQSIKDLVTHSLNFHEFLLLFVGGVIMGTHPDGPPDSQALDLRNNMLGEAGVLAIAEGCQQNVTLQRLKLGGNGLRLLAPAKIRKLFAERRRATGLRVKMT